MKHPIITIEREYGSGGSVVGKLVAEQLGIPFYNHEILEMASERLGVPVTKLEGAEESSPKSFLYALLMNSNPARTMEDNIPVSDKLYITETQIINELAEQGSCVIVGRCANWILRDNPYRFSAFIYARRDFRLRYAQATYGVTAKEIDTVLPRIDSRREKFYNINTGGNWHDKGNYALCLNSGVLGIESAARILVSAVEHYPEPEQSPKSETTEA
ncbi:MAG: cytidylate kinase-like family protein [Oscillospiraceae bacterium]|nr:cytidylate kinase-like family protein [Oscillospiraceae bacterium]